MTTTVHGLAELAGLAGTDLGRTPWVPVDQAQVAAFAHATHGRTHDCDATEEGSAPPLGGPVADGFHTLGLVGTLVDRLLEFQEIRMNVIYGVNRLRLPSPVPVGARVRLHAVVGTVAEVRGGAMEMLVDATVEVEGDPKPACVAQVVYRIYA
ncbi:MaoC family dehydratase (plasmid) [Streptomyces sp. BHT-5-2]|uniref:MaoC/PaaZ C-terminal domain-containing protein n=1 Tax=Streptomyces sp. BHT-5-2 TaxID=2866715 RepID=UPI001C8DFF9E|nr:MaoC/PaaZ C-terminal domain-containing protein [Streptomyces sp. BHT-5-2]QZL07978.1 MaoC family dehydratase [Streptomyces sp. BHT-5-2]